MNAYNLDNTNETAKANLQVAYANWGTALHNQAVTAADLGSKIESYERAAQEFLNAYNLDNTLLISKTYMSNFIEDCNRLCNVLVVIKQPLAQTLVSMKRAVKLLFDGCKSSPDNSQIRELVSTNMLKLSSNNLKAISEPLLALYKDNMETLRMDAKFTNLLEHLGSDYKMLEKALHYNESAIAYYNRADPGQAELIHELEESGFIERNHVPLSIRSQPITSYKINVTDYSSTLTPIMQTTLSGLYDLFHNHIAKCVAFLKPLDEYIKNHANNGQNFENVPEGNVIRVGSHLYTLPPEDYDVIKHKDRLLQRGLDEVLSKHGLDVESAKVIFCGFVDKQKANDYVRGDSVFAENVAFGHAITHGQLKHIFDAYSIAQWLEKEKLKNPHTPSLKEVLNAMVSSVSEQRGSLWAQILDNSNNTLLQNKINSNIYMGSTKDATSVLLFNDVCGPYLAGYMRNKFWGHLKIIQECYAKQHNNAHISAEFILVTNAASTNVFEVIKDVSPNPTEYYKGKGYVLAEDGSHYIKPSKPGVKLHIESNVATKTYETDPIYSEKKAMKLSEYGFCTTNEVYQIFAKLQERNPEFLYDWARTLSNEQIIQGNASKLIMKYTDILQVIVAVHGHDIMLNEGYSLFHKIISSGFVKSAQYLLGFGCKIPQEVLFDVLRDKHYDMAELLIANGANVNTLSIWHCTRAPDDKKMTSIFKQIINHPTFDADALKRQGFSLESYAETINVELLELLLPKCDFNIGEFKKTSGFSWKNNVNTMDPKRFELLLKTDPSAVKEVIHERGWSGSKYTLLHIENSVEICAILLKNGADVNAQTFIEGKLLTPFSYACSQKQFEKANLIANAQGFDPMITDDNGANALYYAAYKLHDMDLVRNLCAKYPNLVSDCSDPIENSPLVEAAVMYGHYIKTNDVKKAEEYLKMIKVLTSCGMHTNYAYAQNILDSIPRDDETTKMDVTVDAVDNANAMDVTGAESSIPDVEQIS